MYVPPRVLYRAEAYQKYRRLARRLLQLLAQRAPDTFTKDHLYQIIFESSGGWDNPDFSDSWRAWDFLRQHGFIGQTGQRRGIRYFLSDQAIRWLDWIRFDWKQVQRRAA